MRAALLCVAIGLFLSGCAGREARPISVVQHHDMSMSCDMLQAEIASNNRRIGSLNEEKSDAKAANVAVGVVGAVLFWPALFALDTSNAEDVEMDAHRQRINHLQAVYANKCVQADLREFNRSEAAREPE